MSRDMKTFHVHLVSDSTGETVGTVARASLVQFDDIQATEHIWRLVRTEVQMQEVIAGVQRNPGFVLFTLVSKELRRSLESGCRRLQVPCVSVLDPIVAALAGYLGAEIHARPGRQHVMDAEYFGRIDAMDFVLNHDDGQATVDLDEADVVLVGVSRTSKTPTSIYLANRGIKTANVPLVPGCAVPPEVLAVKRPLIVGLTKDPRQLVQIRKQRLKLLKQEDNTDYVDIEMVSQEIKEALRLFAKHAWPVIDVTRRSIEETAATIMELYNRRRELIP